MGSLQNVVAFVVFLGVLVTVHELGHFLVAKACNVKVLKFSIGFGPRIFGFTRGETEYRIAWIPLGGYVKMAGELPGEDVDPEDAKRSFLNQPPWKRAAIVVAGPVFNLIFPILAYFVVFLGHNEVISNRVGWVDGSAPAAMAGIRPGDHITKIDGRDVRTFEQLQESLVGVFGREIAVEYERDGKTIETRLTPIRRVDSNPIEKIERGLLGITPVPAAPMVGVPGGSAAEAAGLKTFDRVAKINDQPIADEVALFEAVKKAEGPMKVTVLRSELVRAGAATLVKPNAVELTVERTDGQGYQALGGAESSDLYMWNVTAGSPADKAGIKRGDRLVAIDGKPLGSATLLAVQLGNLEKTPFELKWRSGAEEHTATVAQAVVNVEDELKTRQEVLDLGIASRLSDPLARQGKAERVVINMGPVDAAVASVKVVPSMIRKIAIVIGKLFTGDVAFETVGGPIMLYQVASKAAESGADIFIENMALLSINLGLMNLLPIPVLDGFALLAAIWEGIRRRPIPIKAREYANMVGLAMLALLMVMVMKNDITRLLR